MLRSLGLTPDTLEVDKGLMDQRLRRCKRVLDHAHGIGPFLSGRSRVKACLDLDVSGANDLGVLNPVDRFHRYDRDHELGSDVVAARGRLLAADRELRVTDLGARGLDDRTNTPDYIVGDKGVVNRGYRGPILEDQILKSGHFAYLESDLINAKALARWLEENGLLKYGNGVTEVTVTRLKPK